MPTQERGLDGRVVYSKCGDTGVCIEHGGGCWQIKPASYKGKDGSYAIVAGGQGLEACDTCVWAVDDNGWKDQVSTKIVTAANGGSVTSLNLAGCNVGPGSSALLAGVLRCMTALTNLDASSNGLSPEGAAHVANALVHLTAIGSLNMSDNKLGSGGLRTLMGGVTRLTGLTSLDLGSNELSADDGAYVCGAVAAGMPVLQKLSLLGNGFNCSSVVDCHEWRTLGLPQPPDEVVRQGFDSLLQYLLSENKFATNAIRIFVVGESTVRCFQVFGLYARCAELYCF